ncbi:MAG TPA: hypothetical protein DF614_04030 [Methylococcaceae bacterium]|nr:hypothetical protein [Methylococcaceae bacterium]
MLPVFLLQVSLLTLFFLPALSEGAEDAFAVVAHHDPLVVDQQLTLSTLITLTLDNHPDQQWLHALEREAQAIKQRGESWTAGALVAGLRYQEATSGTLHYVDGTVEVPLWNIGQRDANQLTASRAENSAATQNAMTHWRIAGLVRAAIWDVALQDLRLEQATIDMAAAQQLASDITRRVNAGDLAQTDALLIQTEVLKKRSALTLAQAEVMHARKRYATLTQTTKMPAMYRESLSKTAEISATHPALQAFQQLIERKQAELDALSLVGSGQTNVTVGVNSDRPSNHDVRSNNTESFNIGVSVPFGGQAHLEPQLAALNVELNQLRAQRDQLFRDLEQSHHEAEHNIDINKAELTIANELNAVAQKHLTLTRLSFSVGEIDLIDLLKIQSQTQLAELAAKERALIQERDYAFYNQAVGELP